MIKKILNLSNFYIYITKICIYIFSKEENLKNKKFYK